MRYTRTMNWFHLTLKFLLICGVILRISMVEFMEFKADEFRFLMQAILYPFSPVLHSSIQIPHPPTFGYVLSVLTLVSSDPVTITACIALANLLGLWLLYGICKRQISQEVALISTAIVASMPWAILFSRKIWNPDMIFPFFMLVLITLESLNKKYRPWKLYFFAIVLALSLQVHLLTVLSIIPILIVVYLLKLPIQKSHGCIAVVLFIAAFMPYSFSVFGYSPASSIEATEPIISRSNHILWWLHTSTGLGFDYVLGQSSFAEFMRLYHLEFTQYIFWVYASVAFSSFLWVVVTVPITTKNQWFIVVLCLWAIILSSIITAAQIQSVPHYWAPIIVTVPLCFGIATAKLMSVASVLWKTVIQICIVVVIGTHILFVGSFYSFLLYHSKDITGDYGEPYIVNQEYWLEKIEQTIMNDE